MTLKGFRFFADDEDEFGLEDILQAVCFMEVSCVANQDTALTDQITQACQCRLVRHLPRQSLGGLLSKAGGSRMPSSWTSQCKTT